MTSVAEPGPVGTMSLTGRVGQFCAKAQDALTSTAAQTNIRMKALTMSSRGFSGIEQCMIARPGRKRMRDGREW